MSDDFTADITARARWARRHNGGEPKAAWSTGEKLAVALVLGNDGYLADAGHTRQEARSRLSGDLYGVDVDTWLADVRAALRLRDGIDMTVHVDDWRQRATVGRISARWSHMFVAPDGDLAELHALAARIGLRRSWFRDKPWPRAHYDVTEARRTRAIEARVQERAPVMASSWWSCGVSWHPAIAMKSSFDFDGCHARSPAHD